MIRGKSGSQSNAAELRGNIAVLREKK